MKLIADVGATKTNMALLAEGENPRHTNTMKTFRTKEWNGLIPMVETFLKEQKKRPDEGIFGIPGPVFQGYSKCTNLPWEINARAIQSEIGFNHVEVINDLRAIARAIPYLHRTEIETVHAGQQVPEGNIGVVAPGTGLGEAYLTYAHGKFMSFPSEGGHTDFAPQDDTQYQLMLYLKKRFNYSHVSYEKVCSGNAIPHLYTFFRDWLKIEEPSELGEKLRDTEDWNPVIFKEADEAKDDSHICRHTVNLFLNILGAKVGNIALTLFAEGGIFLGGGIPPKIIHWLKKPEFIDSARRKGRVSDSALLDRLSIHVIRKPQLALVGLAKRDGAHQLPL